MLYGPSTHSRTALKKIAVPKRTDKGMHTNLRSKSKGAKWEPIQHGKFAQSIVDQAKEFGLKVRDEKWQVHKDGLRLYGCVDFEPIRADVLKRLEKSGVIQPDGPLGDLLKDLKTPELKKRLSLPKGVGFSLGVLNFNDGFKAATFLTGARISICSNGMLVAEYVVKRKHTSGVDLHEVVQVALEKYIVSSLDVANDIQTLEGIKLTEPKADRMLLAAGETKVVNWADVGKVCDEWRKPTFKDFKPRTGWSMYNAFTTVARGMSSRRQVEVLDSARKLVLTAA